MDQHVSRRELASPYGVRSTRFLPLWILLYATGATSLAGLVSCSSDSSQNSTVAAAESSQKNHPPSIRFASVTPVPLVLGGPISVEIDAEDADGDFLRYEYRWWVNDHILRDATIPSVSTELLKKGDKIIAEIVAFDGKERSSPFKTEPAVVQNSKPVVNRVSLEFDAPPAAAARLKARVDAVDYDGDDIVYAYRWWRNDTLMKEGPEDGLDTAGFARKDSIVVEVTPRDQDGEGTPYRSSPAVVGNAPPKILSKPTAPDRHGTYQYKVQADDPDGDSLLYGLETAPPGMAIDAASGLVSWTVSSELAGTHRVRISVEDGQGGVAWQEFEISIPLSAGASSNPSPRT
jgi:Putative Ig domain